MYRPAVIATSSRPRPTWVPTTRSSGTQPANPAATANMPCPASPAIPSGGDAEVRRRAVPSRGRRPKRGGRSPGCGGRPERIVGIQCNWLVLSPTRRHVAGRKCLCAGQQDPRNHNDQQEQSETRERTDHGVAGCSRVCTSCGSSTIRAMSSPETVDNSKPVGSGFMGDARSRLHDGEGVYLRLARGLGSRPLSRAVGRTVAPRRASTDLRPFAARVSGGRRPAPRCRVPAHSEPGR